MSFYNRKEKTGVCVVRRNNESDEDLIRRFRKKFAKSGILKEYKEKMRFEKPSDKKRRKRAQAAQIRRQEEEKRRRFAEKRAKQRRKSEKQKRRRTRNDKSNSR